MNRTGVVFLYLILFFFNVAPILAQTNKEEQQSLTSVLKLIETQYNVNFSYADANLRNESIRIPSKKLSLQEFLNYIESRTSLKFTLLNENTIVITRVKHKENTNPFQTQYLEEVLITNYLTQGVSLKNDGTTILKTNALGILPGLIEPDVLQTIQALPGIQSVDERVSNVNVRGGTHDQNLILWDGIKMYQSGHFFGLISAFNPYLTQDVVISKNGTDAMYGDGVSSIIDMRSSNMVGKETSGGAGLNLINADAFIKIPFNQKTELQLSARRSLTDLVVTPTYDQYFKRIFQDTDLTNSQNTSGSISKNERFYFYDITTKLIYDFTKKDKLRVNLLNVFNSLNYQEQSNINDIDEALNSKLTQRNTATSIEYDRLWSSKLSSSAQIYLSNYELDATNFDVINNQRLIQENTVYDNGIKLHTNYQFNPNWKMQSGYQFTEVGISNLEDVNNPIFRSYIKEVIRTHAIFNEFKYISDSGNTNAKFGIRGNYFSKFSKTAIEPRLSLSQRFLNYFRLEILGEFKSQSTSQVIDLQNDFLGIEKRRWVLSNETTIPIIKSKQLSTGIRFNKHNFTASIEAYIKKVNGITTRSQGFQNQYQFINDIGSYKVKGLDFLINKRFNSASTWLSYSYSKNNYSFENLNQNKNFPNNVDTRHAITLGGTYSINKFKFALGVNWRTGKPYTKPRTDIPFTNNFINYNSPNSSSLPDYFRTDFSGTYTFKIGNNTNAIFGFSLWNVLNKTNIINTYYVIANNDDIANRTVEKVDNLSLGITPNFSFRIKF